ncbi:hypothetical protein DAEQUDRAFT_744878 [Daedalea quercina L-15889]|uniref:Uncharacterized protein n=1 Tax=Daedalea quercina L-15889 TaxID=1314783 RepID=A0A165QZX4_9APHY|nr:hypothetical protein DAEQUDRAFT_744878 [Daedalea quercina L-15889]
MTHEKPRSSRKPMVLGRMVHAYPPIPIYLDEDYEDTEPTATEPTKSSSTKFKSESTHKTSFKVDSDAKADAIAEATGLTTLTVHGTIPVHTGILPVIPPTTPVANDNGGFSPLPTTTSLAAAGVTSTLSALATHSLSMPKRRRCPTPSLPILQDPFADQPAAGDEESLFGGKERLSARPSSNVGFSWTHYSHPSLSKTPTFSGTRQGDAAYVSEKVSSTTYANAGPSANAAHLAMSEKVSNTTPPLKPFLASTTPARSIYPGTPQSDYGIAVGSASPLTADGMPLLQRSVSKTSTRRRSRTQRSLHSAQEMQSDVEEVGSKDVYDGLRPETIVVPHPAPVLKKSSSAKGRARVKAPYAPGTMLRASSTMGALVYSDNPFDESQYVLPPLSPALKTEATRVRDTKALASALGLASPTPLSPQSTVHPDDSITLAGERRKLRPASQSFSRPQSQVLSPNMEASARLGNLMLANFSSMTSLPSTRTVSGTADTGVSGGRSKLTRKRADDKPPRVPSPPPMPSLAQMALAHTNPEEYTEYASPTYSIYGLYEADRKSRVPGGGGY